MKQVVAYWTNDLGEEMSSRVHATFSHGDHVYHVVHDWRLGMNGHGFVVKPREEFVLVRSETPR